MKLLRHIAVLALLAVCFASCQKEDAVQPCDHGTEQAGVNEKDRLTGIPGGNAGADAQDGATEGTSPDDNTGEDPTGISDDGDDISDSEKTRKKRR